jgi:NAD(P)-dependent dehydrogenase (short-subunit alcohol dehydrogenase family)
MLGPIADISETPVQESKRVTDVNVWANKVILDVVFTRKISVRQVVAISSGAASSPKRGWNAYAISKAALNMLIALYAAERPGTHFCALAPGIVDTPMQDQIHGLPSDPRFPSLDTLRVAKGTPIMPNSDTVAPRLIDGIACALNYPSGSFLDIDTLVKRF